MPEKPSQELLVALAGPLVNVVIAAGLFLGLHLTGNWQPVASLSTTSGNLVERLLAVNVFLVLFNLLPAFPMDGGRVLRSLLAMRMEYARATSIAATIGQGMAFLFGAVGLFTNPMLLFIAFFVWIGAAQEAAAAQMKSTLDGALVSDAMQRDFRALSPHQSLGEAVRLLLNGSQRDFPVVENGLVVGMLNQGDLFKALREREENVPVSSAMASEFETVDANELLDWAMAHLNPDRGLSRTVLRQGTLVGLLTAENLGEFFLVRAALEQQRKRRKAASVQPPPLPPRRAGARLGTAKLVA
jgi:CBS domain-containing protein